MMLDLQLFTDVSVNSQSKLGYGAYLLVSEQNCSVEKLKNQVKTKRFEQTSSTKLELQSLLWALNDITRLAAKSDLDLTIYTDCQNIISLPARQAHLEQSQFLTSKNKLLNHYLLYQEFYRLTCAMQCTFIKLVGHQRSGQKQWADRVFSLVDKASRQALRAGKIE